VSKPTKPVTTGPLLQFEKHLRDHIAQIKKADPEKGASISVSTTLSFPKFEDDVLLAEDFKRNQSEKARKPRGTISETGETISAIIGDLAARKDAWGDFLPTRELWPALIGELDQRELDPHEREHATDPKKSALEYDTGTRRTQITYGRFQNAIAAHRKKKSR
jgi:hypothetical protein